MALGIYVPVALTFAIAVLASAPAAAASRVDERELLGESFEGRPIHVFHRGDPEEIRVLVVECIHGDECAHRPGHDRAGDQAA